VTHPVTVRYRKYPDRAHWRHDLRYLGEDDHGVWLGGPVGTIVQRADEEPIPVRHAMVQLIPERAWWSLIVNDGGRYPVYVDVTTPARWSDDGSLVEMVDLDLDVVRTRDGTIAVLDEDEFVEHSRTLRYPDWMVARARTTAAELVLTLESAAEPFGTAPRRWLDTVR
jgi:protein associated with RNAse G/E